MILDLNHSRSLIASSFLAHTLFCACAAMLTVSPASAAPLWEIGKSDHGNAEFALAPKDHDKYRDDGFFIVGQSDAKRDWPYAHPGPADAWAGNRLHTFTVVFGIKSQPSAGNCRLVLDLLDTHSSAPPRLRVDVNGTTFERDLPNGAGDQSVQGEPSKGRPYVCTVEFPANLLRAGNNDILITTTSGSWMLYDAVRLETPDGVESAPVTPESRLANLTVPAVWLKDNGKSVQPIHLKLRHIGPPVDVSIRLTNAELKKARLTPGLQTIIVNAPASEQKIELPLAIMAGETTLAATNAVIAPPAMREIWILPHSHVDIGYTHRQEEVIDLQIKNLVKGMELAKASAGNPPGMRFKWNPEAVWSLDHFLQRATPEQRNAFVAAVRNGEVGVDALYGNMLTGLCRPEELAQCLSFGARLSNLTGVPVASASICDVPGYTWGIVPMMAQAGVKYFAIGPNFGDRVGTIHVWDDKPFYWKSASGNERVLCWIVDNYHHAGDLEEHVLAHMDRLNRIRFPYDTAFIFWVGRWPNGGVDNAPPDEDIAKKVMDWNAKYAAPKVVIGLAGEYFREFERRHGSHIPEISGDITPYWEDGAGSTSKETALNRASGDRLSQAATLFSMREPSAFPVEKFDAAWKNVLLYSEHTWGAWNSISDPDNAFVLDQWKVKARFATDADKNSRELLDAALPKSGDEPAVQVFNTTQWTRSDLATIPGADFNTVLDSRGAALPSQRLSTGELVFFAKAVPPFGSKEFTLSRQSSKIQGAATAQGNTLRTSLLTVVVDERSGAIKSLRLAGVEQDFRDPAAPVGLNEFRYVLGTDTNHATGNGAVKISVLESGPLVASLRVESDAPGCNKLVRDIRVVEGRDWVEVINQVDRKTVRQKDSVHFGYGFNVPGGTVRMETPWAVVRPDMDQTPGANRNWYTVQRWVDISNPDLGVTWAPIDAPLMQIGGMTANLLGSVSFSEWMTNAFDSQTIYSWAQNNHWHTNYKIDQLGLMVFRYIVRPHRGGYSAADAARFGMETTRPLLPVRGKGKEIASLFTVSSPDVLVETVGVSEDKKALIVRLFGVSGKPVTTKMNWSGVKPASVWLSDLTQKPLKQLGETIEVPGYDVVNLRAELK